MDVYVQASVDPSDVLGQMTDSELREVGVVRTKDAGWTELANAIRRADFREAERLLNEMAIEQNGRGLPEFAITGAAYVPATPDSY